jgi:YegS/Rv2252/BmrU family lipid kinase
MASEDASSGEAAAGGEGAVASSAVAGRPLALLVNPTSAGGRTLKLLPRVEAVLDSRRVVFRVRRTKGLEDAAEAALRAVDAGEVPVVMGGDGLVGAVGGAMAGAETPLGIIPGGRGNDLVRVLGIPTEPEAAIATVLDGEARRIDVGEANGERFLGIASCGFDSDANRIANQTRFLRGNLVYAYAALRALAGWKSARFHIVAGSERRRVTGWSVIVANSKAYGGGMFIAPDAELDDGRFDVVSIGETGKLNFLRNLPKVFKGTHIDNDEVTVFRAARLELSASRPFAVYADGEHLTDLPATLRVLPRALSVLVPRAEA